MTIEELNDAKLIIAEHGMKLTKEKCADIPFTISLAIALTTMDEYERLKANYENRLKADMVAMLTDIQLEIEEMQSRETWCDYAIDTCICRYEVTDLIQQKIDALKAESEDNNG